jgi:phosphoribosylformylglycinamidine synthase
MAMGMGIGVTVETLPNGPAHAALFGEDQARYVVTVPSAEADAVLADAKAAGVPALKIGRTGGTSLALPGEPALAIAELRKTHEDWLPSYMAGKAA